eukprot:GEMP01036194.1.p1 GENE.GEMP01036194.1~~GEMP01036194.1.p1  ORF type:complete len:107 (+),score=8.09 GEMP01036194.1:838-1158(+)
MLRFCALCNIYIYEYYGGVEQHTTHAFLFSLLHLEKGTLRILNISLRWPRADDQNISRPPPARVVKKVLCLRQNIPLFVSAPHVKALVFLRNIWFISTKNMEEMRC